MATRWWSRRFVEVLESYGLGARMQRGRRYARTGQVIDIEVSPGHVAAQVQGSRATPYLVTASIEVASNARWAAVLEAMRGKVGFVARLLDGEVPEELEEVFAGVGLPLFPATWGSIRSNCTCPDWENPCKHIAAVLYVLADRLDSDPWLVLLLRGRERDVLLEALTRSGSPASDRGSALAPWWPFGPGPVPPEHRLGTDAMAPVRTGSPSAVLDAMEPLAVQIGSSTFVELLRPLYDLLE